MNRVLKYSIVILIMMAGCKKENTTLFSEPANVRVQNVLDSLQTALSGYSSPNGWKVTLYPEAGGGYSFWMKFNDSNRVTMVCDISDSTATVPRESSYRLKALQQPTLLFDTYNYIHILSDPNGAVNGGSTGTGLESDFEFAITSDTLIKSLQTDAQAISVMNLTGRFNGVNARFEKATATEAAAFQSGQLDTMMNRMKDFVSNPNFYMKTDKDSVSVAIDAAAKSITFTWNNGAQTLSTFYATSLNGIVLKDTLNIDGASISSFTWDNDNQNLYTTVNGQKISINVVIIPLADKFGLGNTYQSFFINGTDSQSPAYTAAFESVINSFKSKGYITAATLSFMTADTLMLDITYYTSKIFEADYLYGISTDNNGNITFGTVVLQPGRTGSFSNGNSHANDFKALIDFFSGQTFTIEWPGGKPSSPVMGGLYLKNDNSVYVIGALSR